MCRLNCNKQIRATGCDYDFRHQCNSNRMRGYCMFELMWGRCRHTVRTCIRAHTHTHAYIIKTRSLQRPRGRKMCQQNKRHSGHVASKHGCSLGNICRNSSPEQSGRCNYMPALRLSYSVGLLGPLAGTGTPTILTGALGRLAPAPTARNQPRILQRNLHTCAKAEAAAAAMQQRSDL